MASGEASHLTPLPNSGEPSYGRSQAGGVVGGITPATSPWAAYSKLLGPEVKALDVDGRDGPVAQLEVEGETGDVDRELRDGAGPADVGAARVGARIRVGTRRPERDGTSCGPPRPAD